MAILFDLDGTLLDTSQDLYAALSLILKQENRAPVEYEKIRRIISLGSKKILARAFELDPERNAQHAHYLEQLTPRFIAAYADKYHHTVAFPGIDELLQNLNTNNLTWGIVTNKNTALTKPILQRTGYVPPSECVVCGDTTPQIKPSPMPLLHACKLIGKQPEECVYVGDAITDIQAGKAAGMKTIAAAFGFVPENVDVKDWQADHIAYSPAEIFPWIEKWSKQAV